jgi:hypothetical protein
MEHLVNNRSSLEVEAITNREGYAIRKFHVEGVPCGRVV